MNELIQAAQEALEVLRYSNTCFPGGKSKRLRAIERLEHALESTSMPHRRQFDVVDEGDYDLGLDGRPNSQRA